MSFEIGSILKNLINSYTTYKTIYDAIRGGFLWNKMIYSPSNALETAIIDNHIDIVLCLLKDNHIEADMIRIAMKLAKKNIILFHILNMSLNEKAQKDMMDELIKENNILQNRAAGYARQYNDLIRRRSLSKSPLLIRKKRSGLKKRSISRRRKSPKSRK